MYAKYLTQCTLVYKNKIFSFLFFNAQRPLNAIKKLSIDFLCISDYLIYVWSNSQNFLVEKCQRPVTRIVILQMRFGAQSRTNSKMRHVHAIRATILHFAYPDHTACIAKIPLIYRVARCFAETRRAQHIRVHVQQCKHARYFDNTLHFDDVDSIDLRLRELNFMILWLIIGA